MRFPPVGLMWNLWNRSPFLSPTKCAHCCTDKQEEMRYEGAQVKASPLSRRRMTLPTPMQSFCLLCEGPRKEGRGWNARERTIIGRTKQYLEKSGCGSEASPERSKRRARAQDFFETFDSNDMSFMVADWSRWDKCKRAPWRHDSSASARDGWWQSGLGHPQEQLIVS